MGDLGALGRAAGMGEMGGTGGNPAESRGGAYPGAAAGWAFLGRGGSRVGTG